MVTMFNPKPQLLRAVDKPENVSSQEIAKARPVYIDGLPEGGGGAVDSVNGQTGTVVLDGADIEVTGKTDVGIPDGTSVSDALGAVAGQVVLAGSSADWHQIQDKPTTVAQIPWSLGSPGQVLAVNAEGNGLEWVTPS